jgi:hypothetical protein
LAGVGTFRGVSRTFPAIPTASEPTRKEIRGPLLSRLDWGVPIKRDCSAIAGDVHFSNRPFRVKHFQTVHLCGVEPLQVV